jgi:hypothetical protein
MVRNSGLLKGMWGSSMLCMPVAEMTMHQYLGIVDIVINVLRDQ